MLYNTFYHLNVKILNLILKAKYFVDILCTIDAARSIGVLSNLYRQIKF